MAQVGLFNSRVFMRRSFKPLLPGLVAISLGVAYSVFWFVMAGRIEKEIETWVARQAEHGTEVSYERLDISGYPFHLVATFDRPEIIATDHESEFSWAGDRLRIVTQVYDINHIIIDLIGRQSVTWIDFGRTGLRTPSHVSIDFDGKKLHGSLLLEEGRIESIDTDFQDVSADIFTDGVISLLPAPPDHLEIRLLEYHSRITKDGQDELKLAKRDVMVVAEGIITGDRPMDKMDSEIQEVVVALTEEVSGTLALHSGDIGANLPPTPAQKVKLHDVHILWPPLSVRLDGTLKRDHDQSQADDFNGKIHLYLKGHEDLVRQMAEDGDVAPGVALIAGALFGVLSLVSETNENGEMHIPLTVKDGDVYFGFLPLFSKDDYQ
jgi:hypothetical protein